MGVPAQALQPSPPTLPDPPGAGTAAWRGRFPLGKVLDDVELGSRNSAPVWYLGDASRLRISQDLSPAGATRQPWLHWPGNSHRGKLTRAAETSEGKRISVAGARRCQHTSTAATPSQEDGLFLEETSPFLCRRVSSPLASARSPCHRLETLGRKKGRNVVGRLRGTPRSRQHTQGR